MRQEKVTYDPSSRIQSKYTSLEMVFKQFSKHTSHLLPYRADQLHPTIYIAPKLPNHAQALAACIEKRQSLADRLRRFENQVNGIAGIEYRSKVTRNKTNSARVFRAA